MFQGIFGQQQQQQPAGGGLFGQPQQGTQQNVPSFGGGQSNVGMQPAQGIFVQNQPQNTTGGGIFGQQPNSQGAGLSLFGQAATNQNNNTANSGGLFGGGGQNQGQGLFGGQGSNTTGGNGMFGGGAQQQGAQGGLFGATAAQPQAAGIFGTFGQQQQNPQQQQTGGLFGTTPPLNQQQSQLPTFCHPAGVFTASNPQQPQQAGGLFGQATQQSQQGAFLGGLGQQGASATQGGSIFGGNQATGGLFGQQQQQQQPGAGGLFGQQANPAGIFGNTQQQQPQGGLFGAMPNSQQQQNPQCQTGFFAPQQNTASSGGIFGGGIVNNNLNQGGLLNMGANQGNLSTQDALMGKFFAKPSQNQQISKTNQLGKPTETNSVMSVSNGLDYCLTECQLLQRKMVQNGQLKPGQQQQQGGIFGAAAPNQPTPFGVQQQQQQNTGSLFGAQFGATQQPQVTGGLFGAQPQTGGTGQGILGNQTTGLGGGGGLFGALGAGQQQPVQGQQTGGIFGSQPQQQQQQQAGGGLFGGLGVTAQTTSSQQAGGSLFQNNQQQTSTGGGLFGGGNNTAATGGGLFGGNTQTQAATTTGGGGLFGGNTSVTTGGGLFGGNNQQQQVNQPAGQTGGGLFGGNTATPQSFGGNQQGGGLFGTTNQTGGGLFGGGNQQTGGGLFSNTQQQQQGFSGQQQQQQNQQFQQQSQQFQSQQGFVQQVQGDEFFKNLFSQFDNQSIFNKLQKQNEEDDQVWYYANTRSKKNINQEQQIGSFDQTKSNLLEIEYNSLYGYKKPRAQTKKGFQKEEQIKETFKKFSLKQGKTGSTYSEKSNGAQTFFENNRISQQQQSGSFSLQEQNIPFYNQETRKTVQIKVLPRHTVQEVKERIINQYLDNVQGNESASNYQLFAKLSNGEKMHLNDIQKFLKYQDLDVSKIEQVYLVKKNTLQNQRKQQQQQSQEQQSFQKKKIPILPKGYGCEPSLEEMQKMNNEELKEILNFKIFNDFATVLFTQPVNVLDLDLRNIKFEEQQICLFMLDDETIQDDEESSQREKLIYERLNKTAVIEFHKFGNKQIQEGQSKESVKEKVNRLINVKKLKLIKEYDVDNTKLIFLQDRFED
ncbi:macronuclear nucleoporin up98a, putative [Ichthyophthirius multifiliis]|uniref:Macronuclear nucleoporin up98a, putative n=1 Tax=Ichthyophthirius multifiliis TaxID=5932 RepID=G0QME1_ICHMU|nr:macronuclear nucleoporin up98a, putative [Ichthyophthirius multifiliis]EGR33610.1 macronuclear nucleoporin up98a, putative [Ichthyophthirius multifiliis]|eukprot:XP_004037596.1 macronuclear nucleoporin up98a, putative [Ichthyophthirius multifiliis]